MRDSLSLSPWARIGLARAGVDVPALRSRLDRLGARLAISGRSRSGPWQVSNGLHPLRETPALGDLADAIEQAIAELEGQRGS
jgi:hypothetical protein